MTVYTSAPSIVTTRGHMTAWVPCTLGNTIVTHLLSLRTQSTYTEGDQQCSLYTYHTANTHIAYMRIAA